MVRHAARRLVARVFLFGLLAPSLAFAMPGELDPTFGTNGVVRMDLGFPATARIEAAVEHYNGSTAGSVVAGTVTLASGEAGVVLGRFRQDGSLDTTFGSSGWVVLATGSTDPAEVRGVAVKQDAGVLVLVKSGSRTGLAQRQPDGSRYPPQYGETEPDIYFDPYAESLGFEPRALALTSYGSYIHVAGSMAEDPATPRGRDAAGLVYPSNFGPYAYVYSTRYSIGGGDDEILAIKSTGYDLVIAGRTREPGGSQDAFVARVGELFGPLTSSLVIGNPGDDETPTTLVWDYGRVLVGGRSQDATGKGRFFVASVMAGMPQLSLDPTFGSSGTVLLEVPPFSGDTFDATLRSLTSVSGVLVLAGDIRSATTGESRVAVAWLNAYDGSVYPWGQMAGWAVGGYYEWASRDEILAGMVQDNQYSLSFNVFERHTSDGFQQVGLRRLWGPQFDDYYNSPSGGLKLKAWQRRATDTMVGVARTAQYIFVLGTSDDDMVLARLRPDGSLDEPGYPNGPAPIARFTPQQFPYEPVSLSTDAWGRLVVGSQGGGNLVVSRFDSYLQPDYSFGSGGTVVIPASSPVTTTATTVGDDGTIMVAGWHVDAYGQDQVALAKVTDWGQVDPNFSLGGAARLLNVTQVPRAIAFQPDGKLLVAGGITGSVATIARLLPDGTLDLGGWGQSGQVWLDMPNRTSVFNSLAISPAGTVYASGFCNMDGWKNSFCSAGYHPDGTLDDFGFQVVFLSGRDDESVASALTADGKLVVAGDSYRTSEFKAIALHADGTRDTTFGPYGTATSGQYGVAIKGALAADGRMLLAGETVDNDWLLVQWQAPMDTVPAPFSFGTLEPVPMGALITSPAVTIDGTAGPAPIRGDVPYSIGCNGTFTTQSGTINSGQTVCVQLWSATQPQAATTGAIFVGGVKGTFTVRTGTTPDVTLLQAPANPTGQAVATFAFSSSDATAFFQCTVDGTTVSCASPYQTAPLADGSHTFNVVAITPAGSSPAAAHVWRVDTTPPQVVIDSQPLLTNSSTATIQFHVVDASTVNMECSLDGAQYAPCASPVTYSGLASGAHDVDIRATDAAGNIGSWRTRWTVDTVAPQTTITSGPPALINSPHLHLEFTSDDPTAVFECDGSGTGNSYLQCTSPVDADYPTLADGTYTVFVRAKDAAGNVDPTPASVTFTLDRAVPETSFNYAPTGVTNATTATASFFSEAGATFECRLDGGAYTACTSPVSYANLAEGAHSVDVRAKDAAGNYDPTPASSSWTIDRTAPETSLTNGPSGTVAQASPTFEFSSPDGGATFQCAIDSGAWFGCVSPHPFYNLADGTHLFEVRAVDAADNFDPSPATRTWTIDTTAPNTSITSGPDAITPFTAASFEFSSADGVSFRCSLDGAAFAACTSPANYAGLAGGGHSFAVYAIDVAGNADPSPATWSWAVDISAPDTTITSGPSGATAQATASIAFTSDDGEATFECRLDGAAFAACTSPVSLTGLADGAHTFEVRAKDAVGNADATPAASSWTVDTVAPDTTMTGGPSGTVAQATATLTFTSNDAGATFECRLDGAAFAACTSPANLSGLASTTHVFEVRAKDAAGNVDATPASRTWTVDAVAPDTSITSSPAAATNATSASFAFTSSEAGSTFECKLDAGSYAACTSPKAYSGLAAGSHTFSVKATDAVGNQDATPASFTWTVDLTPPDTTITGGPSGNNNPNTATFTFTSTEPGSTFECKLDAGTYAACVSGVTYNNLARGSHTFSVRARDAAGNLDASPATRNWKSN